MSKWCFFSFGLSSGEEAWIHSLCLPGTARTMCINVSGSKRKNEMICKHIMCRWENVIQVILIISTENNSDLSLSLYKSNTNHFYGARRSEEVFFFFFFEAHINPSIKMYYLSCKGSLQYFLWLKKSLTCTELIILRYTVANLTALGTVS